MKKFNFNSLTAHIWSLFTCLIFVIFVCLFLLHTIFYDEFYDFFKRKEIFTYGEKIESLYVEKSDDFMFEIEKLALNENLTIAIFTSEEFLYNPANVPNLKQIMDIIDESNESHDIYRDEAGEGKEIFVYITKTKINNETYYIYLNTPIEKSTIAQSINQSLIGISAVVAMLLGVILSFVFSRYLSKPIRDLNDTAFLLSNGNYDVVFPNEGYNELRQLGISMNKAKDELMKTDTLQKEFIANVSHDLRTPLTLIQSYAEMIRDLSGDNKEKREEHLSVIISEVNRLSSLVTDVLEITKVQADKKELNLEKINISSLVSNVLDKVKLPINENKIKLTTSLDKKAFAKVDEVAFNQIVYNYILNAITYTKNSITVKVEIIDNNIHFKVTDNGMGIKEEDINQIWDRYYRSKENHERHKHGSGLGLSIVKKIVEKHNFEYGVNSIYEQGSTFYVILPLEN